MNCQVMPGVYDKPLSVTIFYVVLSLNHGVALYSQGPWPVCNFALETFIYMYYDSMYWVVLKLATKGKRPNVMGEKYHRLY